MSGGSKPAVGFLFDPMVPGAQCLCLEGETPDATGDLARRYIDERYDRESQEVLDQVVSRSP